MADGSIPTQEIKTLFDEVKTTFKGLQDKVGELEVQSKKRQEDPLTKEALAKHNAAIDKIKDEINALWRKNARGATSQVGTGAAIETKALGEFARWMGADDPSSAKVIDAHKAYKSAFRNWMRKGDDKLTELEKKTLSVGEAPSGGFWVEPARADWIIQKIFETSALRPFARKMTISTDSIKVPVDRQRTNANWVGEQSSRNATTTAQIGEMMIAVHELQSQPAVTQNMIDDAMVDIEAWAQEKIVQDFMLSENTAFVTGNGVFKPRGFTTYPFASTTDASRAFGTVQYLGTGSSGAWRTATATVSPADDLLKLIYAFKAPYRDNLRFGGTRTTLGTVRQFKDQLGNFIAGPRLDQNRGLIEQVLGFEWDEFADMDEIGANSYSVVMADWSKAYIIVDRQGIRQLRDPYTSKPNVLFDTTKRVGGDVMDTEALKFIKFA
jgi:HK97 family phage major capsid protein